MLLDQDTIVAISTPPGRGGIGIVRLSGPDAYDMAIADLRLHRELAHAQARFAHVVDEDGQVLDEAIVTWFQAPHSYTTEDVVEIAAHGAPVLLEQIVRSALGRGARLAEPGEFTQRAYLSGRLDLTQAEAVHDLIAAQTLQQAKTAAAQLGGSIARVIQPVKDQLIALIAALEAGVDFVEDDLDLLPEVEITRKIAQVMDALNPLASSFSYGRILREGARLAIVGQPNAGKSSLFNQLLGRDRAIVTAQPGTTRDPVSECFSLNGIPLELVDTAGLREVAALPENEAEREGILRSRHNMAEADLVLHVVVASQLAPDGELSPEDQETQRSLAGRPALLILSKCDLADPALQAAPGSIRTSAATGEGIADLKQTITRVLGVQPEADLAVVTNLRQSQALDGTLKSLHKAHRAAQDATPHEFLLMDLHTALESMDTLTGTTTPEDILQLIFSSFCIGK